MYIHTHIIFITCCCRAMHNTPMQQQHSHTPTCPHTHKPTPITCCCWAMHLRACIVRMPRPWDASRTTYMHCIDLLHSINDWQCDASRHIEMTHVCVICSCICMYIYIYICMYVYVCIYIRIYIHIAAILKWHALCTTFMRMYVYIYEYVCMYICIYTCIYMCIASKLKEHTLCEMLCIWVCMYMYMYIRIYEYISAYTYT